MTKNSVNASTNIDHSYQPWVRVGLAYLLFPLILWVTGGDLGWWQAWVYSLLIMVAGLGGRIWAEQMHPGLTAERQSKDIIQHAKPWDKVLAPLMALSFSYFMVIVAGLDHRFASSVQFALWVNVVGFVLIGLGYAFATWALVENRFFYSVVVIETDRGQTVCDTGPYRFVRHPGYAGNLPPLFGIVLALDSLWALVPAGVAMVITVMRTALEDRALQAELPGYKAYVQKVRYRLIPGIY